MTTLEDKILGEKNQYYCSSSEDEDKEEDGDGQGRENLNTDLASGSSRTETHAMATSSTHRWDGVSRNTGPKGVLEDWYLFQKHEEQIRMNKERELITMIEQTSLTCLPTNTNPAGGPEKDELESDSILQDFIKQRMEAMLQAQVQKNQFLGVEEVNSADSYLKLIDDKESKVTIILHIYESSIAECVLMNDCLNTLSGEHRHIKFCKMRGSVAGLSKLFKVEGVPALLVYRGGDLIGNFIRLKEEFGREFYAGDVENYLIENGILGLKSC